VLLIGMAVAGPGSALAWDHEGHMVVAYIAYAHLSAGAKARVDTVLQAHPDLATLTHLAGSSHGGSDAMRLFVEASRWPDLIKNDGRFYDENNPNDAPTRQLPGFPDMKMHKPWHYIDIGFSTDGTPLTDPPPVNARTAIHDLRRATRDPHVSAPHEAYDLSWLEHLVGDVHQPLHCAALFSKAHPRGDDGGTKYAIVPLELPGGTFAVDTLHALWDDVLGDDTRFSAVAAIAKKAEASSPPESLDAVDESAWIQESFEYAKAAVYRPLDAQSGAPTIPPAYIDAARTLALQRIKLAGHRLAAVIEADLR
jgi:hypothetical protein